MWACVNITSNKKSISFSSHPSFSSSTTSSSSSSSKKGVDTEEWTTSSFKPSARPPDNIQNFLLPGVSPYAESVEKRQTGAVGQINLKDLTLWYHSKNLEGKKHTLDEWKTVSHKHTLEVLTRSARVLGSSTVTIRVCTNGTEVGIAGIATRSVCSKEYYLCLPQVRTVIT